MKYTLYIGITGFTTTDELTMVERIATLAGVDSSPYQVMAGIITSSSTLQKSRSAIRVGLEEFSALTQRMPSSFIGAIHHHTHDLDKLEDELNYLLERSNNTRLVQINNTWPSPHVMQRLQNQYSNLGYVLQFPPNASSMGVKEIALRASAYQGLAHYTLVDPSQGYGKTFDPLYAAEIMNAASETLPDAIMGVAGGLCGNNVCQQLLAVAQHYHHPFVIDAEGRLRSDDHLHLVKEQVQSYLSEAVEVMNMLVDSEE